MQPYSVRYQGKSHPYLWKTRKRFLLGNCLSVFNSRLYSFLVIYFASYLSSFFWIAIWHNMFTKRKFSLISLWFIWWKESPSENDFHLSFTMKHFWNSEIFLQWNIQILDGKESNIDYTGQWKPIYWTSRSLIQYWFSESRIIQ